MSSNDRRRRWLLAGAILVGGALLGAAAFAATTWNSVGRVEIDRPTIPAASEVEVDPESEPDPDVTAVPEFRLPPVPYASDHIDTVLLVGVDDREGLEDLDGFGDFEGGRADVILLMIRPRDGGNPALISLPRDLWVSTPCGQERINETLEGCEEINGETTLLVTVESLTGLGIDHMALVDLAGFQEVVDDVGGYRICLDLPVRDEKANLSLPAGCQMADGEDTLAWLRSRQTQELHDDGQWRTMSGVSDLTRNERQRTFLVDMIGRLSDLSDPQEALSMANTIAPHVTVDSSLGLSQAVSLAWTMRGLGQTIDELSIPVEDYTTSAGAEVLVPADDVESLIAELIAVETVTGGDPGSLTGMSSQS